MSLHLPSPLEIDPRPCGNCGLTIDRHLTVDDGDGPLFHCIDWLPHELTLIELERRAELIREIEIAAIVREMELADPRDRWRHTGEPPPPAEVRNGAIDRARPPTPYRPAQCTVSAFRYVVRTSEKEAVRAWLAAHSKDAPLLLTMLEKCPC